jgi:hypothetical protein
MWVNGIEVDKSDMAALNKNASTLRLLAEEVHKMKPMEHAVKSLVLFSNEEMFPNRAPDREEQFNIPLGVGKRFLWRERGNKEYQKLDFVGGNYWLGRVNEDKSSELLKSNPQGLLTSREFFGSNGGELKIIKYRPDALRV